MQCIGHSFGLSIRGQDSLQSLLQRGSSSYNCSQRMDGIRGDCRRKSVNTSQQSHMACGQSECETSLVEFRNNSRPLVMRQVVWLQKLLHEQNTIIFPIYVRSAQYLHADLISRNQNLPDWHLSKNISLKIFAHRAGGTRSGYDGNSSLKTSSSLLLSSERKGGIPDRLFHTRLEQIQTSIYVSSYCNKLHTRAILTRKVYLLVVSLKFGLNIILIHP